MENKLYALSWVTILICMFVVVPSVSASIEDYGTYIKGDCVKIIQTNSNATWANISSILYPDSALAVSNIAMTKVGAEFNYTFCSTGQIGKYMVNGVGDSDKEDFNFYFTITPTGTDGGITGSWGFYIIVLAICASLITLGFYIQDGWFVVFGGLGLIAFGIYSINFGVVGYKDMFITWMVGLFEIGVGAYLSINSALQMVDLD